MARPRVPLWIPPLLAVPILLAAACPALAHGIGDEAAERSIVGFISVGLDHFRRSRCRHRSAW